MDSSKRFMKGLSFDDVLLRPERSDVLPRDVDLSSRLTRNITVNVPLLSAAMDTVTESRLAIAIAQEGGIGIIHKNLSIEDHASEIDRVKRSQAGVISAPFTLRPQNIVQDAENLMSRYHVSGVPITNDEGILVGILTNRDLRFLEDYGVTIESVMTKEDLVTVPPGTTFEEAKELLHRHRIEKLPIVEADGRLVGLITIKDIIKARDFPQRCRDEKGRLRVGAALGIGDDELERAKALVDALVDVLVVDTAHGHTELVIDMVDRVKNAFPDVDVIAGNVVTSQGARDLIAAGADAVKVGVGPGSICTTRVVAGAGMPQLSAIIEVAQVCSEAGVPVIADGGIRYSGDIVKAIAGGADTVMIGSLFAGTEESPGETVLLRRTDLQSPPRHGLGEGHAAREQDPLHAVRRRPPASWFPRGLKDASPFRGALTAYVHQLLGGLRSGMGYCGCHNIAELQTKPTFVQVSAAGVRESHPHDITITEEPPNYQVMR